MVNGRACLESAGKSARSESRVICLQNDCSALIIDLPLVPGLSRGLGLTRRPPISAQGPLNAAPSQDRALLHVIFDFRQKSEQPKGLTQRRRIHRLQFDWEDQQALSTKMVESDYELNVRRFSSHFAVSKSGNDFRNIQIQKWSGC
jgi:hypothetical protein